MGKAISSLGTAQGCTNNNTWQLELPSATTASLLATGSFPVEAHPWHNNQLLMNYFFSLVWFTKAINQTTRSPAWVNSMTMSSEGVQFRLATSLIGAAAEWPTSPGWWAKDRLTGCLNLDLYLCINGLRRNSSGDHRVKKFGAQAQPTYN